MQPYISGTGGQGTSRRILGSVVPIVSSSRENGNACQHSPEHGNKMYEREGDLHTSAAIVSAHRLCLARAVCQMF